MQRSEALDLVIGVVPGYQKVLSDASAGVTLPVMSSSICRQPLAAPARDHGPRSFNGHLMFDWRFEVATGTVCVTAVGKKLF